VSGGVDVKNHSLVEDLRQPMSRAPRMQVPEGTNLLNLFYLATSPITSPITGGLGEVDIEGVQEGEQGQGLPVQHVQ
jgi:hypothetical protein